MHDINAPGVFGCPSVSGVKANNGKYDSWNLPSGVDQWQGGYGITCDTWKKTEVTITKPSATMSVADVEETGWAIIKHPWPAGDGRICGPTPKSRHNNMFNAAFFDGHAASFPAGKATDYSLHGR